MIEDDDEALDAMIEEQYDVEEQYRIEKALKRAQQQASKKKRKPVSTATLVGLAATAHSHHKFCACCRATSGELLCCDQCDK